MATIDRDSKEIRTFPLADTDGRDISADVIQFCLTKPGVRPADDGSDFITVTWSLDFPGQVAVPFNLNLPSGGIDLTVATGLGPGTYMPWYRLFDTPETPWARVEGVLTVT